MRKVSLSICLLLVCNSCKPKQTIVLSGKIVVKEFQENKYSVYTDGIKTSEFRMPYNEQLESGLTSWANTENAFIGWQRTYCKNESEYSICKFDTNGKVIDTIYEVGVDKILWPYYLSRNNKYLIASTHDSKTDASLPLEGLNPSMSLLVIDTAEKRVICEVNDIGRAIGFHIEEYPWLSDNARFVYSLGNPVEIIYNGQGLVKSTNPGVYLYDIRNSKSKLLISDGYNAIVSPDGDNIAYQKNDGIYIMNLNNSLSHRIYKVKSFCNLRTMHWTPDGKYIYFIHAHNSQLYKLLLGVEEEMIDCKSDEEVNFAKIGHGYYSYMWK